jgi:hypothetical protein
VQKVEESAEELQKKPKLKQPARGISFFQKVFEKIPARYKALVFFMERKLLFGMVCKIEKM